MGRPKEYCSPACVAVADAIRRLQRAIADVPNPQPLRSLIVAEVLNRIPVDPSVLSERARRQVRNLGGRFAKNDPDWVRG